MTGATLTPPTRPEPGDTRTQRHVTFTATCPHGRDAEWASQHNTVHGWTEHEVDCPAGCGVREGAS